MLDDLYNHHFKSVGQTKIVSKEDLADKEIYLAYKYLADKGLVEATPISGAGQSSSHRFKITIKGIDNVEMNMDKK